MIRDPRARILEDGLLPIVRVEGEDARRPMAGRMAHYHVPGISVAVIKDGRLDWAEGFGVHEAGQPRPIGRDTMFAGASISKPVTAVVALKAVEQGLFDLDADVNRYLKTWQLPDNEFTRGAPVTLRWLLSHRAGTTVHGFGASEGNPTLIDTLEGRPPAQNGPVRVNKVPGGKPRYSGGGITIIELMLAEATGKPFHQLAQEQVFGPLGMTRTTFEQPLPDRFRDNAASGHNEDGSVIDGRFTSCPQLAAGGIYTTASDYAHFMIACRDAWQGKPGAILGRDFARQMMDRDGTGDQGLGWRIIGEPPHLRMEHGGSCQGYQCETTLFLESGDGVVVLTNGVGGLSFYWEVINTVAEEQGWQGFLPPRKKPVALSAEQHAKLAGTYTIVSGVEAPAINVWTEGDRLYSEIVGMRGGKREVRMDVSGRLFNGTGPYDTAIEYGPDGRGMALTVYEGGTAEILRAERKDAA
jgi:CubicO group peptidase (beta-lactamase class C family)